MIFLKTIFYFLSFFGQYVLRGSRCILKTVCVSNVTPGVRCALEPWWQAKARLLIFRHTHRADFQLVALERLQPHQGPDASTNQDFIANVVFQDVGQLLGIACRFVGQKAELIPRLAMGAVKEMQVVTPHPALCPTVRIRIRGIWCLPMAVNLPWSRAAELSTCSP